MTLDNQEQPNEISGGTSFKLTKGSTNVVEALLDPGTHWYNGMIFGKGNYAKLSPSFGPTNADYYVHFWISKGIADVRFISFSRRKADNTPIITLQHYPLIA